MVLGQNLIHIFKHTKDSRVLFEGGFSEYEERNKEKKHLVR
jgi:hypothetical protein